MIKRVILSTVGLGLLGTFFFGRTAASYVSTSWARLTDSVEQSVPVEFQIDRARKMVKDLMPDIQRNMHVIAKEEVEVDQLERQIADTEQHLGKDRSELMRLKTDASSNQSHFVYAGRSYTVDQV